MKIKDLIGGYLKAEEREILRDALKRTGDWLKFEAGVIDFDEIELPEATPATADEALARLDFIDASLDEKRRITLERSRQRAAIHKAAQKVLLAALERGLPALLSAL